MSIKTSWKLNVFSFYQYVKELIIRLVRPKRCGWIAG
jgi:hypothetical protein